MSINPTYIKGRGAQLNTVNKFEKVHREESLAGGDDTIFIKTTSKSIVNTVDSPDIPLPLSMNPYQGCEHGCIYCYARNTHTYWGYSAGLDFEQKILIKEQAPKLLRKYLNNKNYSCQPIMLSGNTDCYQPAEQTFKLTRQLLEICLEYNQPVGLITKNALVLRDADILQELAKKNLTQVLISLTSLEEPLRQKLEPRTSTVLKRLQAISTLNNLGIPVSVMMAPVIPGLTDHEIFQMAETVHAAGARDLYYTILRLNGDVEVLFNDWLLKNFPDRAEKIIHRTADCHGGKVSDHRFSTRMKGEGNHAEIIRNQFKIAKKKAGLPSRPMPELNTNLFFRPGMQLNLGF